MRRLLGFLIILAIAWYGWKHYGGLRAAPANEVVIENATGHSLGRVRLSVGGDEYPAHDSLSDGESITQPFPLASRDGSFRLRWTTPGHDIESEWNGGQVTSGPVRMRHHLQVMSDGGVVWTAQEMAATAK